MDLLQIRKGRIVDAKGQPVMLRGTCIGGWMNMENFINGYPGAVHSLREALELEIGKGKTEFFFERLMDHFFNEDDVKFIRSSGATVIRIPVNYRHFEDDARPFKYKKQGFERLDGIVKACAKHGLYVIIDLHSVPGYQNPDWHCDNATNYALFWQHPHFQDRFVAIWEEFARRYKGNATIAGYNVMNEPVTSRGSNNRNPYTAAPNTDWAAINALYKRVVKAIRAIDPAHIIFLEGDHYSSLFSGLSSPFAPNLVYSSHNYMAPGLAAGAYPGSFWGSRWDKRRIAKVFADQEGSKFAAKHNVPLWVGEFGAVFNGPKKEIHYRLRGLDDQLDVMNKSGAHWTTWTYKDVGVMGWAYAGADSAYMRAIKPAHDAKVSLHAEGWGWMPPSPIDGAMDQLSKVIVKAVGDRKLSVGSTSGHMSKVALSTYVAGLLQTPYARCFKGMSESKIDSVLSSFSLKNCTINKGQVEVLKKHLAQ